MQESQEWKQRLARAAARRARAEVEFLTTIAEIGERVPQTQIAVALHTGQPNVSRWAAKGRAYRDQIPAGQIARTPYEVIQAHAAGEITRQQMLEALSAWPYTEPDPLPVGEWDITPTPTAPGSFEATVGRAYDDGLLSAGDYDTLVQALTDRT